MRWQRILEAAGAALVWMLPYFIPLILPGNIVLLHRRLALTHLVGGALLDLLFLTILGWAVLALLPKLPEMPRFFAGAILVGILLYRVAAVSIALFASSIQPPTPSAWSAVQNSFLSHLENLWPTYSHKVLLVGLGGLIALSFLSRPTLRYIVRSVRLGLTAISFCSLWIVPQLFHLAFFLHQTPDFEHSIAQSAPKISRRVIWLLFDELSYKLIFEHPPYGHEFSNFSKFHSQSTSFTDIVPVGFYTERIIPSLLADHEVDNVRSTSIGRLQEQDSGRAAWVNFDPNQTLLALAQAKGWSPGVAGWYFPYCRYFEENLTTCTWNPGVFGGILPLEQIGASEQKSIWANSLVIPRWYLTELFSPRRDRELDVQSAMREADVQDYQRVTSAAEKLIDDGQVRFLFIHLPVPHPPGIFNRKTHQLCACGNYLDNLWLADDTLGMLQNEIDKTPWAGETTVIVSSDHSWRTPMWRASPDWTAEEEQFAQGGFDRRPVFMVHFPGQKSGEEIAMPTPELMEHDIVEAMLRQQIASAEEMDAMIRDGGRSAPDTAHKSSSNLPTGY